MTRGRLLLGMIAALAMSVSPALAQRSAGSGSQPTGGSAVSRGGGDSGGSSAGGGGGSSSSGVSAPRGGYSAPSVGSRDHVTPPSRPSERATGRTRSGSAAGSTTSADSGSSDPRDRAVPAYSRPRGDRPATGTAVQRTATRPGGGGGGGITFLPGYWYGGYYVPSYAFGLGFYDPFWYDPYAYGYGYGYGGYSAGGGYPYGGYGYGSGSYDSVGTGSLRLKIKPNDAQVYVDGYFVGTVDEFDGVFQRLKLDGGNHRIEIRSDGYETFELDVLITPGETVTYEGELKRIQ